MATNVITTDVTVSTGLSVAETNRKNKGIAKP